ncbi:MAG: hypothetical protein SO046_00635 [Actinomyces urogenitalis]|uniref:hypothetical protein n=1 Tax=Actinomyces urogenitalis TaxID=103621 RepID=UPI002A7F8B9B|nr:hypothetical protein [Actinomyces urogenitalis]MDY3677720.1 hypothetical protein [Actinomyces urogenitalis]
MSMNPVDPASAGFCHARARGEGVPAPRDRALAQVISSVLGRCGDEALPPGEVERAARDAVSYLRPALELLRDLRGSDRLVWDGLVHRRLRLVPPASGPARSTAQLRLVTARRGGWELTEVTAVAVGWQTTIWLARRDGDSPRRQEVSPRAGTVPSRMGDARHRLLVRDEDVWAWASASGDDNRIHLEPGAGRGIGLTAHDGVMVHGMLLAALSLALVPARDGLDARLVAPVVVDGAAELWASPEGDLYGADGLVLRRRS